MPEPGMRLEDAHEFVYFRFSFQGESRKPKEEYSLSNCTWYKDRSCCGRTEVTSVFQEMMPIDSSSVDCYNHMNYLMCYFCSPDQYKWYRDGKLHVCKEFCQDVYDHCKDAKNGGKKISSMYSSGKAFCEAQAFLVVDNNENCFEFDSTHFDAGTRLMPFINLIFGVVSILLLL